MLQLVRCPHCGTEGAGPQFCTTCGLKLPLAIEQEVVELEPASGARPAVARTLPRKYGALRAVAVIYIIIGWVICVGGSLLSIAAAYMAAQGVTFLNNLVPEVAGAAWLGAVVIGIVGVVVSVLGGLFFVAFAELCNVVIDIEQNTRSKD
jgi:hypothetical protein